MSSILSFTYHCVYNGKYSTSYSRNFISIYNNFQAVWVENEEKDIATSCTGFLFIFIQINKSPSNIFKKYLHEIGGLI